MNKHLAWFVVCLIVISGTFICCQKSDDLDEFSNKVKFQIISEIKLDSSSPFYIDFKKYPAVRNDLPIGIFDSGTGGLTVLDAVMRMDKFNNQTQEAGADGVPDFISEHFIYLGDKANMPYGRYDSEGKSDFLKELVLKDVQFLLGKKYYSDQDNSEPDTDKSPVKAIVIACNTATAYGLDLVREALNDWSGGIEVIGIIEAGAKAAVSFLGSASENHVIGVFATEGACASEGYPRAIKRQYLQSFKGTIGIVQQPGFGLAGAIDGDLSYIDPNAAELRGTEDYQGPGIGNPRYPIDISLMREYNFIDGNELHIRRDEEENIIEMELNSIANYIRYYVTQLVVKMRREYPGGTLDAVILGCTHYPFFQQEFKDHFLYLRNLDDSYAQIIPEEVKVIDPAISEAVELYNYMQGEGLFSTNSFQSSRFFISVPNPLLKSNQIDEKGEFPLVYKYGRSINQSLEYVKKVPFSKKWIGADVLARIKAKMPDIYKSIFEIEQ